jgi:hypothetical protein
MKRYIFPGSHLDFRKFIVFFHVVLRIHLFNVFLRRCAQNLDNFDKLIDLRIRKERRMPVDHFDKNASHGPHINLAVVIGGSEDQFRRPVAPGANVGKIGLS